MKTDLNIYWMFFHIFQIAVFQFYATPRLSQLVCKLLRKRNLQISDEVLGNNKYLHSLYWDYAIGLISLALIIGGYYSQNKMIYWAGKYTSVGGFLFTNLLVDLYRYEKLKKLIPLTAKRSASLTPRTLGRIVPLWAWSLNIMASLVVVFYTEMLSQKIFLLFGLAIFILAAISSEKKSKMMNNTEEDELYRKTEAWHIFWIACTFPIFIPLKKHLGHVGIDAVFSTAPLIFFIIFLNSKIYKRLVT